MSEAKLEQDLLATLTDLKYAHRKDITNLALLEANFRQHFNALNKVTLSDTEFDRLLEQTITPNVFTASQRLRERNSLVRDDDTILNYTLVNLEAWCKNTFEVINQLRINTHSSHHRYDVMLLINGLPMVQIELKSYATSPRRAMQQIIDYKNDVGNGYGKTLLCFLQMFIVSNGNETWYFANNNPRHFAFDADERFLPLYQFADRDNNKIPKLEAFAKAFLAKCVLAQTISRYMVLVVTEEKLMMMRPYQMYAVQSIVDCIEQKSGNGYIWHTTGSGKTLTSFKASTLLKENEAVDKCLFVVDRKDLDKQTREEFNRFQEGCVEQNTNTKALVDRLLSTSNKDKVIVTTIQKLGLALDATPPSKEDSNKPNYFKQLEPLRGKRMVFIFDECHRSQFGENHKAITAFFPNAQLFGFTGTPIFDENATSQRIEGEEATRLTTEDVFSNELHAYTITHAIEDRNVLSFRVEYYKSDEAHPSAGNPSKQAIVQAILKKHDKVTAYRKFNALFATASINDAIEYVALFKQLQAVKQASQPDYQPLNIACVFSPPADGSNPDIKQLQQDLVQEQADNKVDPESKKAALTAIIADYNTRYGTNHSISEFDSYYQDVQQRIKYQQYPNTDVPHAQKIDITIVVDMLLTGFDSKYLNTLYVDKNLKHHGLIQAFSRTNRVLNDTKPYGNIIDFRCQEDAVNAAIAMFSGKKGEYVRNVWLVEPAQTVLEKLTQAKAKLHSFMQEQGLTYDPSQVANLKGDTARTQFVQHAKEVQRLKTQLDQYTDLTPQQEATLEATLPTQQWQGFKRAYLETAKQLKDPPPPTDPNAPPADSQQLDLELVLFSSVVIDYDYIMGLVARFTQQSPKKESMTRQQIIDLMRADAKFMDDIDELTEYINGLKAGQNLSVEQIKANFEAYKASKHQTELATLASTHGLDFEQLQAMVAKVMLRKVFDSDDWLDVLLPLGLGWKARSEKEKAIMLELIPLLKKMANGKDISGLAVYEA